MSCVCGGFELKCSILFADDIILRVPTSGKLKN